MCSYRSSPSFLTALKLYEAAIFSVNKVYEALEYMMTGQCISWPFDLCCLSFLVCGRRAAYDKRQSDPMSEIRSEALSEVVTSAARRASLPHIFTNL